MRLLQITDLHIGQEGEYTYGVDVRKNFLSILEHIKARNPDHLIISGDLCYHDGERLTYEWMKALLESTGIPFSIISGNHDDPKSLAEVFGLREALHDGELYYEKKIGGQKCLFLDTTTGVVSTSQMQWLNNQLGQCNGRAIVFMHHPPVLMGVPYMDENHSLQNRDAIQEAFLDYGGNVITFSGHYHIEKTAQHKNVTAYVTPSCFFQIDQQSVNFKVDHMRIGYREIELFKDGLRTTVKYLEGHKSMHPKKGHAAEN